MLPSLKNHQVNVFMLKAEKPIDQHLVDFYMATLNQAEQLKYQRFHFEKDRQLYLCSHAMLRLVLAEYLNCAPQSIEFETNKYGKPNLKAGQTISFNLSHAKHAAALIISVDGQLDLGIDIESVQNREELITLADHYFSDDEAALLVQQNPERQSEVFFKLWTLKESYIKSIGKGLSIDLNSFSFGSLDAGIVVKHHMAEEQKNAWFFAQATPFKGYQMALAVRSKKHTNTHPKIKTFTCQPGVSCTDTSLSYITSSQF